MQWDPATYLRFDDARARPYHDLVGRIGARDPKVVVDLGCGPGNMTVTLVDRWPSARVIGIDSSPEMIRAAELMAGDRLAFAVGDLAAWRTDAPVDVIVSNAALQWVPSHRELLRHFIWSLNPGGWLAFQVPGNFESPSHLLLHELATDPRFAEYTAGRIRPDVAGPEGYLADLVALGTAVDAWETTYLQVLPGDDAVFGWMAGTGARPVLQALPDHLRHEFENEYRARLRDAYPPQAFGTVLPFRRIFVVAHRAE